MLHIHFNWTTELTFDIIDENIGMNINIHAWWLSVGKQVFTFLCW